MIASLLSMRQAVAKLAQLTLYQFFTGTFPHINLLCWQLLPQIVWVLAEQLPPVVRRQMNTEQRVRRFSLAATGPERLRVPVEAFQVILSPGFRYAARRQE